MIKTSNIFLFMFLVSMANLPIAMARVMTLKDGGAAPYVRATMGKSRIHDDAIKATSGELTRYEEKEAVESNFGGEAGLAFQLSEAFTLRVGAEIYQGRSLNAIGFNAAGAKLLEVESSVFSFLPKATFEYGFYNSGTIKVYTFLSGGLANVKVANAYTVTTAGQTAYNPGTPASYSDVWVAEGILVYDLGFGTEFLAFDNFSASFELGWRQFNVDEFEYDSSGDVIRGSVTTAVTAGDTVLDNEDKKVSINMGGLYFGVVLRFYLPSFD